jgi:MSHA pilin protein MshD
MSTAPDSAQGGLTLIELVIFIAVIAIGITGILQVMNLTAAHSGDPIRQKQALALAEGLLEEVQGAQFSYCDPADGATETAASAAACTIAEKFGREPGDTQRPYNNVNDYVSAPSVSQASFNSGATLVDASGTAFPLAGYTATVKITPEVYGGITSTGTAANPADDEAMRITVTVNYGGDSVVLEGYRTRYAPKVTN